MKPMASPPGYRVSNATTGELLVKCNPGEWCSLGVSSDSDIGMTLASYEHLAVFGFVQVLACLTFC